jgi:predicted MPP superfamily phosphohydrolase
MAAVIFRLAPGTAVWYAVLISKRRGMAMQETVYSVPGCPAHIALVTDLHETPFEAVLASLRKNRPELICVAGDFIFGSLPRVGLKVREAGVLPFFSACAGLAPCFVSFGNHEWMLTEADCALLRETGAVLLDDSYTVFDHKGTRLIIGGLTSARRSGCQRLIREGLSLEEANEKTRGVQNGVPLLSWLDAYCREKGYRILLCHHPEYYPRYLKSRDIPLILSGHAHGGQVRVFGQGLYAPGQGIFPEYTSGMYDGRLIVSRGIGDSHRIPRINNDNEYILLTLT